MRGFVALCSVGAVLVLIVVAASATIRLAAADASAVVALARGVHRAAASLAALAVVALAFLSPRVTRGAALGALALTLALSIVGWVTGTNPPLVAAVFNQLGGIALAALLAWLAGRASPRSTPWTRGDAPRAPRVGENRPGSQAPRSDSLLGTRADRALALAALGFAAVQALGGAAVFALWKNAPLVVYILHAACGLATTACVAAAGIAQRSAATVALAAGAPALGIAATLLAPSVAAQAAHALAAASLLAAAAYAHGRTLGST